MAVGDIPSQLYRYSPDEFRRLVEAGVFDEDARVELIDGFIVAMSPKSRAHERAIERLAELLFTSIDATRFRLRVTAPLTIGASEPEPDLAVVSRDSPEPHHPATAALVVEIAASSQRRDLVEKPRVYAGAGVPVYWVVDLDGRRAIVHRNPGPDGYAEVEVLAGDALLDAPGTGIEPIALHDLLEYAER